MEPVSPHAALNLLVCEGNEAIRMLMRAIFRRQDVTVDFAGDGRVALDLLRNGHYDAVVLDLILPKTSGLDVIRELKSIEPELLGRTIVLTGASEVTLRMFDDCTLVRRVMRKPFEIDEFVDEVLSCRAGVSVHPN